MGVLNAVEHIFNENGMQAKGGTGKQSYGKGNRACYGPRVSPHSLANAREKKNKG